MTGLCYVGVIEVIGQPSEDGPVTSIANCGKRGRLEVVFPAGTFLDGDLCEVVVAVRLHGGTLLPRGSGVMLREIGDIVLS